MSSPVAPEPPPLAGPNRAAWARLGVDTAIELSGGHQSRVYRVALDGQRLVVKLTDTRLVDGRHFATRVDLLAHLAHDDPAVVGPVDLAGQRITPLDGWLAVAYPDVDGRAPDLGRADDVARMGRALAVLHRSLRGLPTYELPLVAALRTGAAPPPAPIASHLQLLHGDWSATNLLLVADGVRILDFDDCGYGTVAFDVGNALYMVLFDATLADDLDRYQRFRTGFVAAYEDESGAPLTSAALEAAVEARRGALGQWLDDLSTAPIGIRTSSPQWRRRLRSFVDDS